MMSPQVLLFLIMGRIALPLAIMLQHLPSNQHPHQTSQHHPSLNKLQRENHSSSLETTRQHALIFSKSLLVSLILPSPYLVLSTCYADQLTLNKACTVNAAQNVAGSTEPCTLQFTGTPAYAGSNPPQAIENVVYNKKGTLSNMTEANFPITFSCLSRVDVVLNALAGSAPAQTAFFFDNVTYNAYLTK